MNRVMTADGLGPRMVGSLPITRGGDPRRGRLKKTNSTGYSNFCITRRKSIASIPRSAKRWPTWPS